MTGRTGAQTQGKTTLWFETVSGGGEALLDNSVGIFLDPGDDEPVKVGDASAVQELCSDSVV